MLVNNSYKSIQIPKNYYKINHVVREFLYIYAYKMHETNKHDNSLDLLQTQGFGRQINASENSVGRHTQIT